MANEYFPMVDAYPQIRDLLEALPDAPTVTERWPRKQVESPTIVVTEISNNHTDIDCVDQLGYQIDLFMEDLTQLRRVCDCVDEALWRIGFRRTMKQPWDSGADGARMTLRYSRRVDKRSMRLIN